jgi:hypothetical protein
MTVVPLDPSQVAVDDQEGDGTSIVVAAATFPSAGFLEVLADDGGVPGAQIARSEVITDTTVSDVELVLDAPLDADATLWVAVRVDFDEDRELSDADPTGLTEDGEPALGRFGYTFVDPDADDEDEDGDGNGDGDGDGDGDGG